MKSEQATWRVAKSRQFDLPVNAKQQSQRNSYKKMTPSPYRQSIVANKKHIAGKKSNNNTKKNIRLKQHIYE